MKNLTFLTLLTASIVAGNVAFAGNKYPDHKKGHPRQNEVNKRLDNETQRAQNQMKSGKITPAQAAQMERQDRRIYNQEQAFKKENGGNFITKKQQALLNKEENAVNREDIRDVKQDASGNTFNDKMKGHPRQDEVNKRLDNQTERAQDQLQSGKITSAQAQRMERQDQALYNQEQLDKKMNGGNFITKQQQGQLNREENAINREDARDLKKDATAGQ